MYLLTLKNCHPCKDVKSFIEKNNLDIEIKELGHGETEFDGVKLPENAGFPILYFGKDSMGRPNMLLGAEGIVSYLERGYLYVSSGKYCPLLKKECIEKKCTKFNILLKGLIAEGACVDYWTTILLTELISKKEA